MLVEFEKQLSQTLEEIKSQGLYKTERIITTPQDAHIAVAIGIWIEAGRPEFVRRKNGPCAVVNKC